MGYYRENKKNIGRFKFGYVSPWYIWAYDSASRTLRGLKAKANFTLAFPCDDRTTSLSSTVESWSSPNNNTNNDTRQCISLNKAAEDTRHNIDLNIAQEEFGRKVLHHIYKTRSPIYQRNRRPRRGAVHQTGMPRPFTFLSSLFSVCATCMIIASVQL